MAEDGEINSLPTNKALGFLKTTMQGLTSHEAEKRLLKYGKNILQKKKKKPAFLLFAEQFNSFIVWILIFSVVISFILGEKADAIVIISILILNAILGFIQEYKAERSLEALRKMSAQKSRVIRNGKEKIITSEELVPGDIVLIEAGDRVPADLRILEETRLEANESMLTGESSSVEKTSLPLKAASVAEKANMLFAATTITKGKAKAVVVATGMNTELGKIAGLVQRTEDRKTLLQEKLDDFGKYLGVGTLVICAIVFFVLLFKHKDILHSLMFSVSLAVAAIPEGLPAVVTICLALGVQRMVKKNALIRKLSAVETLGSTDVICTDKTGTLTYNQMTVRKIFVPWLYADVTGHGYSKDGELSIGNKAFKDLSKQIQNRILLISELMTLCNDAKVFFDKKKILGDPTEAALIVAAKKAGTDKAALESNYPRIDELPFDSDRKLMTTVHIQKSKTGSFALDSFFKKKGHKLVAVKGAPDVLLERCSHALINGKKAKLTKSLKKKIAKENEKLASSALRVLAIAFKIVSEKQKIGQEIESRLVFAGLVGMIDPPRKEAKKAIMLCKKAGIKVVMITGDHKATAVAIARELGLGKEITAVTGQELDKIKDLRDAVNNIAVYARVSPEHKYRIVDALQDNGYVVAMTGDGVNDAPALKHADIGVAMGISGTEVSKEASSMVLLDDNFATIVNAVKEGRAIYSNIKKFILYLLSSNFGEVLTIFFASLISPVLPLFALQLLWMNIVTDALPALALGVEKPGEGIMEQKPRKKSEKIITKSDFFSIANVGAIMTLGTLGIFYYYLVSNGWSFGQAIDFSKCISTDLACKSQHAGYYAVTMAFTTLVFFQFFNVFNNRTEKKSIFKFNHLSNKKLLIAVGISVALQLFVIFSPLNAFFKTVKIISLKDWAVILAVCSSVIVAEELRKYFIRKSEKKHTSVSSV